VIAARAQLSELEQAREAMQYIDLGCDRETWHALGRAWIDAGGTVDEFDEMSSHASNYSGSADVKSAFRNIKPGGGTTAKTIFKRAREAGWTPTPELNEPKQRVGAAAAANRAQERATPRAQGFTAAQVFERLLPAPADHPYIVAKGGIPDGLRVVPDGDPLRIAGAAMAGALAVPACRADGSIATIQFIPAPGQGKKLNLPGHPVQGWFIVGNWSHDETSYLCEGIGQAWACWKATGRPAVVAFGAGRVRAVATGIHQLYPEVQLVLVPDTGKEDDAEKLAAEMGCQWVEMPSGWPDNSDVNDLAQRDGYDVLEALLAAPRSTGGTRPRALEFAALKGRRPPHRKWFIRDWLGCGGSLAAGAGGSGKSTATQHQATLGAIGRPYIGESEQPYTSMLVNCEDDHDDLWRRQDRICEHEDIDISSLAGKLHIVSRYGCDNALMVEMQGSLSTTPLFKELREQVNDLKIDVLWLDNVAHLFLGNHDDRTHVTAFVNALSGIVTGRPFAFMLIAHPGKAMGSEYSGSVAWENAVRMRWYLGSQLPDARPVDADDEPAQSDVRYLAKRKANYTAKDYVRFTMQDGLLVPDAAPDGVGAVVAGIDERRAEQVCIDGFHKLCAMGLKPSDSKAANDYLPKQLLAKRLNSGYGKAELVKAMNRLMTAGKFVRAQVDTYSNRTPKMGLVLKDEAL
jgi:putative DNA primase/helicase